MQPRVVGRYLVADEIAAGGMASVHFGRLAAPAAGEDARVVAIKVLHPQLAKEPQLVAMLVDEGRLAARVRHPNVVSTIEVVVAGGELILVMEYVAGESLAGLLAALAARGERVAPAMACTVARDVLDGIHAAHDATDEGGAPLGIVHRDVSPHNVIVGVDGVARVTDFGVAKAVGRLQTTRDGQVKGKVAYMAPEQVRGRVCDRRADVYAAAIVLWEMLVGEPLFSADTPVGTMMRVLEQPIAPPSERAPGVPPALDAIVLRGLSRDPDARFPTARAMADALDAVLAREPAARVAQWVQRAASDALARRAALAARVEREARGAPRARRRNAVIGASALAALVALGGYRAGVTRARGAPREPAAASAAPRAPSAASEEPAASGAPREPDEPGQPAASAPSGAPRAASPARPRRAPAPRKGQCDPPYTVDVNGYHIPKPQCM